MIELCGVLLFLSLLAFIQARNEGFVVDPERLMTLSFIVLISLISIIRRLSP
jgi:hypothetical protein